MLFKYDTSVDFIDNLIIKYYYDLFDISDQKTKYKLLLHLYNNDEALYEYINKNKLKLDSISKNILMILLILLKILY